MRKVHAIRQYPADRNIPPKRHGPHQSGFIPVGDGHHLYYERHGKANERPILFLHGGPGGGFHDKDIDFFDKKKWDIILFDQRGAGRSTPKNSIRANTTDHLASDITRILDHFNIEKTVLFGGSWGSTLALVYTIRNPERVDAMLLRGIFLGTREENDHYYKGGLRLAFPKEYDRFISHVPRAGRNNPLRYYLMKMTRGSPKERRLYSMEYARYELSTLSLVPDPKKVEKRLEEFPTLSLIEAHYLSNGCFIPEGYIMKNSGRLKGIPMTIVQGRYDALCPASHAYDLHRSLPKIKADIHDSRTFEL